MVYKAPEQALFDTIFKASNDFKYSTFDHLPMQSEKVEYPFVHVGEVQFIPTVRGIGIQGTLSITIHIWGNSKQRKRVSDILDTLFLFAANLEKIGNYNVQFHYQSSTTRLLDDTSVPNTILKHGVLELEFRLI